MSVCEKKKTAGPVFYWVGAYRHLQAVRYPQ